MGQTSSSTSLPRAAKKANNAVVNSPALVKRSGKAPPLIGLTSKATSRFVSVSFDCSDSDRLQARAPKCPSGASRVLPTKKSWLHQQSTASEGHHPHTNVHATGSGCCQRSSRSPQSRTSSSGRRRDGSSELDETRTASTLSVPSVWSRSSSSAPQLRSPVSHHRSTAIPSFSSQTNDHITCTGMENAKGNIADRVFSRVAHKRDDFARFIANLSSEELSSSVNEFRDYLIEVVSNMQKPEQIREASLEFGRRQVERRSYGFKADFFSAMAEAMTTECVFSDCATHSTTETIEAWANLAGVMFGHIRDGYYEQVRHLRKSTTSFVSISREQSPDEAIIIAQQSGLAVPAYGSHQCSVEGSRPYIPSLPKEVFSLDY